MKLGVLAIIVASLLSVSEAGIVKRMIKMPKKMVGKGLGMVGL